MNDFQKPYFCMIQNQPLASNLRRRNDSGEAAADRPRVVLVVFVGGCTFAEISALRFLSQQEDSNTGDTSTRQRSAKVDDPGFVNAVNVLRSNRNEIH